MQWGSEPANYSIDGAVGHMWSAQTRAKFRVGSRKAEKLFTTAHPALLFAARLIHHNPPSSALRSSSHLPQLSQPSPSQLILFTTARQARPFEARLIHYSSPSSALRSSSHTPQPAQLGSSQLISSPTARPTRPFAVCLIHRSSPSPALSSSSYPPQLAQPGPSVSLFNFTLLQGVSERMIFF